MMYHVCAGKAKPSGYPICMLIVEASDAKDAVNKWWEAISGNRDRLYWEAYNCAAYAYEHDTVLVEVIGNVTQ